MRVLLTGATGLIGSHVMARLLAEGHQVVAVSRSRVDSANAACTPVVVDLREVTGADQWMPHLAGVDAVVNCAGVLQDSPRDSTEDVHFRGVAALFAACERVGIRRVVHLSAIGVDRGSLTPFSRSKLAGDEDLMSRDLDWVILRPSVVVGRAAYGGSAMFRGLAVLPLVLLPSQTAPLQIVQLEDLVETIRFFLDPQAPKREILEIAGPERLNLREVIGAYSRWLGRRRPRFVALPGWLAGLLYCVGDLLGLLGWRPPVRTTAQREIVRGAVGDPAPWTKVTGIVPTSLTAALTAEPASVQERWFANLYFLKPLVFGVFALFWIATGLVSLGPGWDVGMSLMREGGAAEVAEIAIISGALADIAIGIGILYRPTTRPALYAALAISIAYTIIGTILVPRLWEDPLGPMMKIWPIMVLNLVALAILDER